jgi:hypothetical protein
MKHIKLFESYNNGKLLCYHATGTKNDNWKDIFINGYKIGGGSNYGPGLYTFYNLEDLTNDIDWNNAPVIIEFEVDNYDGFYVEVPEIAIKMFGEYNVKKQIDNIMGIDWGISNPDLMKKIINSPSFPINIINSTKFEREDSLETKMSKWVYGKEFKGIIFDGYDGIFCVIYDTSLASPKRFSVDGGNTWNTKDDLYRF